MRWFIVFLLIANILLFFWVQQDSLRPSLQSAMPPPEIGRLRLINEAPAPTLLAEPEAKASAEESEVTQTAGPMDSEVVPATASVPTSSIARAPLDGAEPSVEAESPESALPNETSDVSGSGVSAVPIEPDLTEPVVPPEAAVDGVAQTVETSAEPEAAVVQQLPLPEDAAPDTQGEAPVPEPVEPPRAVSETPAVPPTVCARVGPFDSADADALLEGLPSGIELLSDSSEEDTINTGYYVLIPALPDRAAGLNKLKELETAGFRDTWLFPRGPDRNAISLGMFRQKGGAERQASRVAAKGFEVEVRARTATAKRRWLQLMQVGGDDMQSLLSLPDGVTLTPELCP